MDVHRKVLAAIPGIPGDLQSSAVCCLLIQRHSHHADTTFFDVGIREALEKAGLQQVLFGFFQLIEQLLHIVGRTCSGQALSRCHMPGQTDDLLIDLVAATHHIAKLLEHDPAGNVLIHMGISLNTDEKIRQLHHGIGNIAVEIQHHTDGHIRSKSLPDSTDDHAIHIGITLCHTGAVQVQRNGIQGLFFVGF